MGMISAFHSFHFLRPLWLLALLPLAVLLQLIRHRRLASRSWADVVDARLLPHLLVGGEIRRSPRLLLALGLGGLLAILALAGPAWRKLEQPVFRRQSALVVLLDLSRSMDAADIKPSRLLRAQLKLRDILRQRKEGDTALIVFAATPFVVTPLTSDTRTIASQLDAMTTDLMPAQGSRPDRAIALAQKLLKQAGATHGGVLLITDGINGPEPAALTDAIGNLVDAGHRLSVLGVGTTTGAPIPDPKGGFVKGEDGAIVIPKLDDAVLAALARQGHGAYRRLSADDSDFHALLAPFDDMQAGQQDKQAAGLNSDQWQDEGPWLLLPLLVLAGLAFRRGVLLAALLILLQHAHPAYAFDWSSLWLRADQRGERAMAARQPQLAAKLFQDPQWRAAADYRAGNYQAAVDSLKGIAGAVADYNRGNALAHLGHLPEAVGAYQAALKLQPNFDDARHNLNLLEKMLKPPQQQSSPSSAGKKGKSSAAQQPPQSQASPQSSSGQGAGQGQQDQGKPARNGGQGKQGADSTPDAGQGQAGQQQNRAAQHSPAAESGQTGEQAGRTAQQRGGQARDGNAPGSPQAPAADGQANTTEAQRADRQWLRRIPDDPGGLWRRKFLYQYKQQAQRSEKQAW